MKSTAMISLLLKNSEQLLCPPEGSGCGEVSSVKGLLKARLPPILFILSDRLFLVTNTSHQDVEDEQPPSRIPCLSQATGGVHFQQT